MQRCQQTRGAYLVLVIEDDPDIRELLELTLCKQGYAVVSARDGLAGLRAFYEWQPAAVVLDVQIPGLDGWELCRRIRQVAAVPVLFLSAHAQDAQKVHGLGLGADAYLTKPFRGAELLARLASALKRARYLAPVAEDALQ